MRWLIIPAALIALSAPAFAVGPSAAEAKKIFFGYDMAGYLVGDKTKWRECIHRDGQTSYWFGRDYDQGRLRIRDDGALCFSYKSTGYKQEACFSAARAGAGWRFTAEDDPGTVFVATHARAVNACPTNDAPIS